MRDNVKQIMNLYTSILEELERNNLLSQEEKYVALSYLCDMENSKSLALPNVA